MPLVAVFVAVFALQLSALGAQPVPPPPPPPTATSPAPSEASPPPSAASPAPSAASPLPAESETPSAPAASSTPSQSPSQSPSAAPLVLAKTRLQLNRNATTAIGLSGGGPPFNVTLTSPVVDAAVDPHGTTLTLRALAEGTATLTITDALGQSVTASVLVAPNAAFVPADVNLALTGSPTAEFVNAQVRAAIVRAAQPLPGATLVVGDASVPATLAPGTRVDAPIRLRGDGANRYVDVDGISNVHITFAAAASIAPTVLFYSDDPENVRADGVLFRGTLSAQQPVRLYYYHQSATPQRQIVVVLDAPSGGAQVTVVGRGAGPNPAVMFVGQSATFRYLDDRARGAGVTLDVPVGAPLEIFTGDRALASGDLVAGAVDFALANGGDPVRVTVLSASPGADLRALLGENELPSDGRGRRGEYPLGTPLPIALAFSIGADEPPPVVVGNGTPPIANLRSGGRPLSGDYGIVRPVNLTLTNPTGAPSTAYLYELPIGYPVTTTIAFDGDPAPLRLQCAKNRNRYLVRAFTVPANGKATITGSYMTDGGSTYPLTFGLTATPPLALPASMTASDGCYPKPGAAQLSPLPSVAPASTSPVPAAPLPSASPAAIVSPSPAAT